MPLAHERSRIEENMARKEESQREKRKAVQIKDSCYFYDLSLGTNGNQEDTK
jgi:hypothetical protein